MKNEIWRKRLALFIKRRSLYPAPDPMPYDRDFWLASGIVTAMVVCFSVYFLLLLFARQDTFQTNAEDFGIMDQAIWSTLHGQILHQTICNIVFDTNCVSPAGIIRFAIHFEPILFPISLAYLVWSNPKVLFVIQTIIVALGAYPVFWLARLRLRNTWPGVAIAALYLLYPVQQQATVDDFHAVTLTAALLLFTLYFMYTRRTAWFFVFAILSMVCKEEISLVVTMIGLWSLLFQRRWLSGGALAVLGISWFLLVTYVVMPHFSPTGHPLLISRYNGVGASPLGLMKSMVLQPRAFLSTYVREKDHFAYIRTLLVPAGYLPLLAPWVLVIALPSILINLISSNSQMYSGLFQYNAEIVPVIMFAVIESLVVLLWLSRVCVLRLSRMRQPGAEKVAALTPAIERRMHSVSVGLLAVLCLGMLLSSIRSDYYFHGQLPFSQGFSWPQSSAHVALAQHFIDMIPPTASVSAQTRFVPHLSQRTHIYMFPYQDTEVDYILLDITGDIYPYSSSTDYVSQVKSVLLTGHYGILAAQDGYMLLRRGLHGPSISPLSPVVGNPLSDPARVAFDLPESFCSNLYVTPQQVTHPLQAAFTLPEDGAMSLVGYDYSGSDSLSKANGYVHVTTYWRVNVPGKVPLQLVIFIKGKDGKEYAVSSDVPEYLWCQSNIWKPGSIIRVTSRDFNLRGSSVPDGLAHLSIALLPLIQSSSTIMDVQARLPLRIVSAPSTIGVDQGRKALELLPLTIVE